jgi:hypothetical protein
MSGRQPSFLWGRLLLAVVILLIVWSEVTR